MAVRFDATTDRLLRTTDILDYNQPYSWMAWIYLVSDLNAASAFLTLCRSTTSNMETVRTGADGVTLELRISIGGSATSVTGTALTVGVWYHIAMVRESATSLKLYLNGALAATHTTDITARLAVNRMEVGAIGTADANRSDSRAAGIKAWSGSMTGDEVKTEMYSYLPSRFTNLYGWWPGFPGAVERLRDYSVSARNWTEVGTLTDEAGPPVIWGLSSSYVIIGGTTFNITPSGSVTATSALIRQAGIIRSGSSGKSGAIIRGIIKAYSGQIGHSGEPDYSVVTAFAGSITPSGALSTVKAIVQAFSGSVTATGNLVKGVGKALSASITGSGAIIRAISTAYSGQVDSSGTVIENVQTRYSGSITPTGTASFVKTILLSVSGSITATGILIKQVITSYSGQLDSSGSVQENVQTRYSGSVTPISTLTFVKTIVLSISGSITATGNLIKSVITSYAGQLTPSGEIDHNAQTRYSGSVTPSSSLSNIRVILLAVSGSITATSDLIKSVGRSISGSISSSGSIIKSILTVYSGQLNHSGEPDYNVQTTFSGSITPTSSLQTVQVFIISILASVTPTGTLLKSIGKSFSGAVNTSGTLVKSITTHFTGQLNSNGEPNFNVQTRFVGSVTPTGLLSIIKAITLFLSGLVTRSGTLSNLLIPSASFVFKVGATIRGVGRSASTISSGTTVMSSDTEGIVHGPDEEGLVEN